MRKMFSQKQIQELAANKVAQDLQDPTSDIAKEVIKPLPYPQIELNNEDGYIAIHFPIGIMPFNLAFSHSIDHNDGSFELKLEGGAMSVYESTTALDMNISEEVFSDTGAYIIIEYTAQQPSDDDYVTYDGGNYLLYSKDGLY